jgi:hypothetical protein
VSAVRPQPALLCGEDRAAPDTANLAFEVAWKWSALGAAARLGHRGPVPPHALIDLSVRVLLRSAPPASEIGTYAASRRLHGGVVGVAILAVADDPGLGVDAALGVRRWALQGSVLATADYLHVDLADERGPWLRLSLPHADRPAPLPRYLWSRLPRDLGIAGGTCDRVEICRGVRGGDHSVSAAEIAAIVSGG